MISLARCSVGDGHWNRSTAVSRHSKETGRLGSSKQNDIVFVPGSTPPLSSVAQRDDRPSGSFDLLKPAAWREEANPAAIRRPERIDCAFSSVQQPGVERIQVPDPQTLLSLHH